tara:strand:- start:1863 stop:2195 length:333 start_codon:yes stop_codon:yes gene_type:complete
MATEEEIKELETLKEESDKIPSVLEEYDGPLQRVVESNLISILDLTEEEAKEKIKDNLKTALSLHLEVSRLKTFLINGGASEDDAKTRLKNDLDTVRSEWKAKVDEFKST